MLRQGLPSSLSEKNRNRSAHFYTRGGDLQEVSRKNYSIRSKLLASSKRRIRWLPISLATIFVFAVTIWRTFPIPMMSEGGYSTVTSGSSNRHNKICFLQSVFGDPSHPAMDRPPNVTSLYSSQDYAFYYFTNMPDLETPGWIKVLVPDEKMIQLKITRHITISRQPKFLAWKILPEIRETCRMVMYMDGHFYPRPNREAKLQRLAKSITESKFGLLHVTHPKGGSLTDEFDRIVSGTKDTQDHVDRSLKWLTAQPDWNNNATLYWNAVFGYDPTNPYYRQASEFFWDRYSQELDSWRDQPLWAYTLHHFGITPLTMRHDTLHSTIYQDFSLKGDHHYANEDAVTYVKTKPK